MKDEEKTLYIDIIIFAVIAGVLAANLYRTLGKKPNSVSSKNFRKRNIDKAVLNDTSSEENIEELNIIREYDKNFDLIEFLEGAKKAFQFIVESFQDKKLDKVKDLLSEEVYESFADELSYMENNAANNVRIVSVDAEVLKLSIEHKNILIKVKFLSEQEVSNSSSNNLKPKSKGKKVEDIWSFEKDLENTNPDWKLVEVTSN